MINKYCTSFNDFLLFMQNIFFIFYANDYLYTKGFLSMQIIF
jgi:hypothetical protein